MVLIGVLILALAIAPPEGAMQQLNRMQHAAEVAPAEVRAVLEAGLAECDTAETRGEQCLNQYYMGELYRLAAAVSPEGDYAEQAITLFRAMRIDYVDLTTGQLGYIGEARVLRQTGKPEEAINVLKSLLDRGVDPRIQYLAKLETMEATCLIDPHKAIALADSIGGSARWPLAKAYAAVGRDNEALELIRSEEVAAEVTTYDRLALIAELNALTDDERNEWATLLASLGRPNDAMAILEGRSNPTPSRLYASLLSRAGRHDEATQQWRLLAEATPSPETKLALASSLEASQQLDKAESTYRELVESDNDEAIRREALIGYLRVKGIEDSLEVLEAHPALIDDDPYLRYAFVSSRLANGSDENLSDELAAIAEASDRDDLRASAYLLQAERHPLPRTALNILDAHMALLLAEPNTAERANALRARLWVELGLIDSATDTLLSEPERYPDAALLSVAEALAARYIELPDPELRSRIMRLCEIVNQRASNETGSVLKSADLMLSIDAFSDAYRVTRSIDGDDAAVHTARALRGMQKPREALAQLQDVTTPQAAFVRGQCEMDLRNHEQAAEAFRAARWGLPVDTDPWWQATFGLCKAQIELGHHEAAAAMLRVSQTLYPLDDRLPLRQQLETLQPEAQP